MVLKFSFGICFPDRVEISLLQQARTSNTYLPGVKIVNLGSVVVAQWAEGSLLTSEVHGSNSVIGKF